MKKVIVEFKGDWSDENIYDFFHHIAYQTELGELVEVGDEGLIKFVEHKSFSFKIE